MKKRDGVVGHGVEFVSHYAWQDGKVVGIITKTQWEMLHDKQFWIKRHAEQLQYIRDLADRQFTWSGRMQQLLMSALEILKMIEDKIK